MSESSPPSVPSLRSAPARRPDGPELEALLGALHRVQGVVEFDLLGNILAANDIFLSAMGYRAEELIGRHHSLLCEPETVQSEDYQRFWETLRSGKAHAGEVMRRHRSGRPVWLQASYNPVIDAHGRILKVVKFATDVTAARETASALSGMMRAIDRSQGLIEFDLDARILAANDNFLAMVGWPREALLGQRHRVLCDPMLVESPEYLAFWRRLAAGEFMAGEFPRRSRDGREVWIQASYNPVFDARGSVVKIVKFATDITARKATERLVARTRQALELSNAAARTGTWEHDVGSARTEFSAVAREVLGLAPDWIGSIEQIAELSRPPGELRLALDQALATARGFDLELQVRAAEGEPRWLRAIGRAEDRGGRVLRLFGTLQDIETQKKRELAEAAARSKDMFLAMMSHELRTPMNAVLGFADLLRRSGRLAAEELDTVDEITRAGHLLLRLINDVLDLSRLEAEGASMALVPVALPVVFEECRRMVAEQAIRAEVSLQIEAPEPPVWVRAHPLRLRQVMLNLLSNAVKYNIARGRVAVRCVGAGDGWVRIEVSDTGRGIPPERLDRLFKPFERLGAEHTDIQGTGIGLSIVRRLVTQMGGEVGVSSTPGEGSTFWVVLHTEAAPAEASVVTEAEAASASLALAPPLTTATLSPSRAPTAAPAASGAVAAPPSSSAPSRGHVLVAEDNPVNRRVIARQLQLLGYTADLEPDGQQAFERWRADPARYALVLTDLQMPVLDGYGLAEAIRGSGLRGADVPVLILSANVFEGEAEGAEAAWRRHGVDAYLVKPLDAPGLEQALETWLAPRRGR